MASCPVDHSSGWHDERWAFQGPLQGSPVGGEPRSLPGSDKLVVIATGHHSPPEGAVAVVDPSYGANNPQGLRYVTPGCSPLEGGLGSSPTVAEGGVPDRGGYYRTPWPLSEKAFLVSYAYHNPATTSYAAYYIDVWGNKELIHRDPLMDVLRPMPVRRRLKPPLLPSRIRPELNYATCYLDDVNWEMPGIKAETVRYLRISEHLQWFFSKKDNIGPIRWTPGTQHSRNFGYWSWSPTRVIGTVPVEKDGSAYFKVPAGLAITFQALDENLMEIRRMRSHVEFQPGEVRGCVGCHETKQNVPRSDSRGRKLASGREPSLPKPPPWGDVALLDYEKLIQPIFNRHCVRCHGASDPKKGLDLTDARSSRLCAILSVSVWTREGHADSPGRGIPGSFCRYAAPRPGGRCPVRIGQTAYLQPRRSSLPLESHERPGGYATQGVRLASKPADTHAPERRSSSQGR